MVGSSGTATECRVSLLWPKRIAGVEGAVAVRAGYALTAVVLRDGRVLTCGEGESGAVGHEGEEDVLSLCAVEGISGAVAVSSGGGQVYLDDELRLCSATAVVDAEGVVRTFGRNLNGLLGDGGAEGAVRRTPQRIIGPT